MSDSILHSDPTVENISTDLTPMTNANNWRHGKRLDTSSVFSNPCIITTDGFFGLVYHYEDNTHDIIISCIKDTLVGWISAGITSDESHSFKHLIEILDDDSAVPGKAIFSFTPTSLGGVGSLTITLVITKDEPSTHIWSLNPVVDIWDRLSLIESRVIIESELRIRE